MAEGRTDPESRQWVAGRGRGKPPTRAGEGGNLAPAPFDCGGCSWEGPPHHTLRLEGPTVPHRSPYCAKAHLPSSSYRWWPHLPAPSRDRAASAGLSARPLPPGFVDRGQTRGQHGSSRLVRA